MNHGRNQQSPIYLHSTDTPTMKGLTLRLVLGMALVVLLLALLFSKSTFLHAGVWTALMRAPWAVAAIALVTALAQTSLSTMKWHRLMLRASPDLARRSGWINLFHYTAASNAFGQVVTPYVAGTLVRGWAMKARHTGRFGQQALLAAFEQVFDVIILLAGGLIALATLTITGSEPGASDVLLLVACLASVLLVSLAVFRWTRPMSLAARLLRRWWLTVPLATRLEEGAAAGLDEPRLLETMLFLSLVRYTVLALRTVALGLLLLPALPWGGTVVGFAAVQISALITLTPGNIGVTEWSWAALAVIYTSIGAGGLAAFALALRLSGALAAWAVFGCSAIIRRRVV